MTTVSKDQVPEYAGIRARFPTCENCGQWLGDNSLLELRISPRDPQRLMCPTEEICEAYKAVDYEEDDDYYDDD